MILVGSIIGIVFLESTANNVQEQTQFLSIVNESHDINNSWLSDDSINTTYQFTVTQAPNTQGVSNLSITSFSLILINGSASVNGTDYILTPTLGNYTLVNTTFWRGATDNTSLASYNFANDNYIVDSPTRNILPMIIIFGSLGILVFVIVMLFKLDIIPRIMRR